MHVSGYYTWLTEPNSARARDDQHLLGLIKHSRLESSGVYGYRKIHDDLHKLGDACGKPPEASPNHLERRFNVTVPNNVWLTDITFMCTYEGWLYLAVVLDQFSRQVIDWSMNPQMTSDLEPSMSRRGNCWDTQLRLSS